MDRATATAFFAEARRDPFLHALTAGHLNAWTQGYIQAARDASTDPPDWDYAYARAIEVLGDEQARSFVGLATLLDKATVAERLRDFLGRPEC